MAATILQTAVDFDAVVLGATGEPLFERGLFGTIPEVMAERCARTVIMVKSAPHPLASSVRRIARVLNGHRSPNGLVPAIPAATPAVARMRESE